MKTFVPTVDPNGRKWWLVDLSDVIMGRCATKVATILRGKHRPTFTPHLDTGDHVVVINAKSVKVTGARKPEQLAYYHYSGYPGGLKKTTFAEKMKKKPEDTFRLAVRRMLPKNRLGRKMLKKLHVYAGPEHRHHAQKPEKIEL
ncbi:MAG: 50S ribosomal protein L13 [candidate division Zixibacteria bacterium]|nr:50S ribosomal protein L13 [candidate division Zixibacteria bacterium]MDH3936329.1 50S ribosomal protein L13 [candidate division Zixibacteria bacterium]MDH4035631.1 50S ribosomal protein L13 [candidate division Zixibacteria bacterium]